VIEKPKSIKPCITKEKTQEPSMVIYDFYKIPKSLISIFKQIHESTKEFYTRSEIAEILENYFLNHGLVDLENKRFILLDNVLNQILPDQRLERDVIISRFLEKMDYYHEFQTRGLSAGIKKGIMHPIVISVKKRSGNKLLTFIKNVQGFMIDPVEFSDALKLKCACASSGKNLLILVLQMPGEKSMVVQVQGKKYKEACLVLEGFGIPKIILDGKGCPLSNRFVTLDSKIF
jgi:translation initiation factor 1 (eIF-1/SUI1)